MPRLTLVILSFGLGLLALGGSAWAQDRDLQPLLDRLGRLERDINMLQRQVYQGAYQSGGVPASVPPEGQSALGNELQISQIQDQLRTLNGQIEELNYNLAQLKSRIDKMESDVELRFSQLEHGGAPAGAGAPQPRLAATAPPPSAADATRPPPGRPGSLGTLSAPATPPARSAPQQQATAPDTAAAGILPSGTPQDQYNAAFGLLRRADYPAAAAALRAFVEHYPNDPLAGNAQYWLGETYYVRKDYKSAATAFAEGYQKYPKGPKAADNLLKLGMALGNLGQKADACKAFARLDRDFPTAPANVKEQESSQKQAFGC